MKFDLGFSQRRYLAKVFKVLDVPLLSEIIGQDTGILHYQTQKLAVKVQPGRIYKEILDLKPIKFLGPEPTGIV